MSVFGGVKNREDYVGDTFLSIPEICEVKKGMHTEVLLNSRSKDKTLNPLCFLSIIAKNRTLDLQCKTSKDRDVLYRSFQGILSGLSKSIKFS